MRTILVLLFILSLFEIGECRNYPGILLQIPTSIPFPYVQLGLPIRISDGIVAEKLQLTEVVLKVVDYSWKLQESNFIVTIPQTLISFHWNYKGDSGLGTFSETFQTLNITWEPELNENSRFKINILSSKLSSDGKQSKISVNLGGNVKESIVIEVTNLILNHAKPIFQQAITNALIKTINSFTQILDTDIKIYCNSNNTCIYIKTNLISKPLIHNKKLLIQISADPFFKGDNSTDPFQPSSVMSQIESTQITAQIHKDVGTQILKQMNHINPFFFTINSSEISGVTDIDTQTLSVVFPKMRYFADPSPVLFIINIPVLEVDFSNSINIHGKIEVSVGVDSKDNVKRFKDLSFSYIRQINATLNASVMIVSEANKANIRINKILVSDIQVDPEDISSDRIHPIELEKHLQTLLSWAAGCTNGDLNTKITTFSYKGSKANCKINYLSQSIVSEIKLYSQ